MYRVDRNNFYKQEKKATVYTPAPVSDFIYNIVGGKISKKDYVLDPCVGAGSLLKPFVKKGFKVKGVDIERQGFPNTMVKNYLSLKKGELAKPSLVIMNPPFNLDKKTKEYVKAHYHGRPLLPEIWLCKALELFGDKVPMILFTPYGLRLNQTESSRRWRKFVEKEYPEIQSIISLPKDVFDGVLFHAEVLIFNISSIKPHYFYTSGRQTCQALKI